MIYFYFGEILFWGHPLDLSDNEMNSFRVARRNIVLADVFVLIGLLCTKYAVLLSSLKCV